MNQQIILLIVCFIIIVLFIYKLFRNSSKVVPAIKLKHKGLDLRNVNLDYDNLPVSIEYGKYVDNKFFGLRYYNLDKNVKQKLFNLLPHSIKNYFDVSLLVINHDNITPHIDSNVKSVINYYIQSGDSTTVFWKCKNKNTKSYKIKNQTDGSIYDIKNLKKTYSFKAKNNEMWLLNVKEIHSVHHTNGVRLAYCFSTQLPYHTILNKLKI